MKNNRGITLIALVITIIVLLILAGVSIAMLTGENGILTQATTARDDTAVAERVERINMELNALYSAVLADNTKDIFTAAEIQDVIDNLKGTDCTVSGQTSGSTTASETVTITADGVKAGTGTVTIDDAGQATLTPAEADTTTE